MERLIYYPGLDPIDRKDLKTFIVQGNDIVFYFHTSKHQHWNFTSVYKRDQAHAFLIDQYTDRPTGLFLTDILRFEEKPFLWAVISEFEVTLYRDEIKENGKTTGNKDTAYTVMFGNAALFLEFHLLVLDIVNAPDLKHFWVDQEATRSRPYPLSKNPLNVTL
jgi:hypothetical protein